MAAGPLVDTSVLIDYFGGVVSPETDALDRVLEFGPPPATAPVILQEFLQGFPARRDFDCARNWLDAFDQLSAPAYESHERAARLHLQARRKGLATSTVDTLIVQLALESGRPLLTRDKTQRALAALAGVLLVS